MQIATDNMIYSASMNLVDIVVDEIALEGMDGITLEALWTRLSIRLDSPLPMSEYFMEQVWKVCTSIKDLKFYELAKARTKLVLFNRYNYVDEDLGTIIEPDNVPDDIYKHCPIDDVQNNVRGSCMDYSTRRLLNNNVKNRTLKKTLNKYGSKLVIVASQNLRENALMGDYVCPTIDLNIKQYCFLERIGRSRYHGEVTQGKRSLVILGEDPKTLFYHRKVLTKHKLITKQMHHQKNSFHGTPGSLLHLVRFFVERKPKMIYLAEKIVDLLKQNNNTYTIDLQIIKKNLQMNDALRKLMKMTFFKKIISTINVPYRKLYPNASEKEWKRKSNDKEKYLYALQLINPNYDFNDLWYNDEPCDDDDYFELDISSQCINRPLLTQANEIVESKNYDGMSQTDLSKIMGLTKLGSRSMFRNLEKIGIVGMYIDDVGRQRTSKYVSRKYEKNSNLSKKYLAEKNKLLEHKRISMSFNNSHSTTPTNDLNNQQFCSVFIKTDIDENSNDDNNNNNDDHDINADDDNDNVNNIEIIEPIKNLNNITFIKRNKLFSHVNRVFKKYKLNRYYKMTYKNLADKFINDSSNDYSMVNKLVLRKNLSDHCDVDIKEGILRRYSQAKYNEKLKKNKKNYTETIPAVSTKKITRKNMISDTLEKYKIIDIIKMMNIIDEKEKYSGTKIDKKSIHRLLEEMEDEKLLKNINITLTSLDKQKVQNKLLICHLSININEPLFQLAIEDAQLKFTHPIVCRNTKRRVAYKKNKKPKSTKNINKNTKLSDDNNIVSSIELIRDNRAGYKYGIQPKFGRMKILHSFLYYRIYDNKNINKKILTRKQQINELCQHRNIIIDDELDKEMSKIYNTDADWKMFIPPLSLDKNSPIGWISMSEIVYFMPLSLCLNIYNPCHIIPDLDEYINHPIRKHYLIKDLSVSLKKTLFDNKYMSSVYESIKLLCYIGLIQFGPHHYKRKDEIEIFVNQKSELINTIDTSPNYYRVDKDKNYPVEKFTFNTMQDVDEYWNRMHYICINTPLGSKLADEGKEIEFERLVYKPDIVRTVQPVGYNQAKNNDLGILPGDKLGAAGIDSAFFSHRKRNWDCINANTDNQLYQRDMIYHDTYYNIRNTRLSKIRGKPVKFTDLTCQKSGPTNLNAKDLSNEITPSSSSSSLKNNNNNNNNNNNIDKYDEQIVDNIINSNNTNQKKSYTYTRKILPRKTKKRKRVKYDDIDKIALQNMNKLRVDWSPHEDSILLMCKVVMMYLCPNPRSQIITFTAVRDVLRLYSSTISQNKTSRACQRRLLYILKDPRVLQSVALRVEEIKQNFFITDKYGDIVDKICKLKDHTERDDKCAAVFKELVAYVVKKYYNISRKDINNDMYKINTIQEFNLIYDLIDSQKLQYLRNKQYDISNVHDIHLSTINSVLYSAMNNSSLTPCDYQFEKIYKQYPEYLLRIAIGKIRSHQMISLKKSYKAVTRKRGNFMPLSSRQYQFSINYNYKFQTKLPFDTYHEVYDFFIKMINSYNDDYYNFTNNSNGIQFNSPTNGGMVIGIYEFLKCNNINFNVEIPDHIIALDPNCGERDETFTRISTRYQDILTSLEQLHFERNSVNIKQERHCYDNLNNDDDMDMDMDMDMDTDMDMDMDMDTNTEESDFNDEIDKQKSKNKNGNNYKTFTWTFPYVKALLFDENQHDNQDNNTAIHEKRCDNYLNDHLIDSDFIRLQDGTVVEITKNDIDKEKLTQFDENIYDIFINTRDNEDKKKHSYNDRSTIVKLKALDDNTSGSTNKKNTSKFNKTTQRKSKDHGDYDCSKKYMNHELIDLTDKNRRKDDQYEVKRRYTRIAMLKMREELTGDLPNSHHAHEYFVVNAFDIFYRLTQIENEKINNPRLFIDDNLKKNILMGNDKLYDKIICDLNEFTLFPTELLDFDAIKKSLIKHFNIDSIYVDNLIDYIEEKREYGATLKDITINFYKLFDNQLYKIISFLTKNKLFLRSGVTETRFIHKKYADPWMIKSVKTKPCSNENIINIDDQDKIINDNEKINNCDINMETKENNDSTASNEEAIVQNKNIQTSDSTSSEKINVIIRPWIKIDGTINHKVFEKMLGAILSHCTMNPGIFMTQVQDRFSPALQYHHTRELIEVLVKLGCLKLTILQKPPSTLFSKCQYSRLKCPLESDGSSEFDDEIIIDTTVCSTVKFSTFLRQNIDKLQS